MRKSFTASLVLVVLLTVVPATAAPRDGDVPTFTKIVRMLKKVFGVKSTGEIVVPIPAPTTGNN